MSTITNPIHVAAPVGMHDKPPLQLGVAAEVPPLPDEWLKKGIIHTEVSRRVAMAMTIAFVLGIGLLPFAQLGYELLHRGPDGKRDQRIQEVDILRINRHARIQKQLHDYEDALAANSVFRRAVRPRLQLAFSRYAAFGDTMTTLGRDGNKPNGWLFYKWADDYVAGPGFLQPSVLKQRTKIMLEDPEGDDDAAPDPRAAIIQFHKDCLAAGAHLVFMPVPVKTMIQPGELTERLASDAPMPPINNPDYGKFIADLKAAGVDVFDPTPAMLNPDDQPRFLRGDTHWTPTWMESVAADLARHIQSNAALPTPSSPIDLTVEEAQVAYVGDIAATLPLPAKQTLFPPENVTIHRVLDAKTKAPRPWREDADVLFLGDSFSNIYSIDEMKWGSAAGLPYQLSKHLGRDLDVIAKNGSAATEVRQELAQRENPLKGKRVVVWEVAMHELTASNWKVIPLRAGK